MSDDPMSINRGGNTDPLKEGNLGSQGPRQGGVEEQLPGEDSDLSGEFNQFLGKIDSASTGGAASILDPTAVQGGAGSKLDPDLKRQYDDIGQTLQGQGANGLSQDQQNFLTQRAGDLNSQLTDMYSYAGAKPPGAPDLTQFPNLSGMSDSEISQQSVGGVPFNQLPPDLQSKIPVDMGSHGSQVPGWLGTIIGLDQKSKALPAQMQAMYSSGGKISTTEMFQMTKKMDAFNSEVTYYSSIIKNGLGMVKTLGNLQI